MILLGLIAIAGLGYYLFVQNNRSTLDTQGGIVANQAAIESADFLRKLNEMKLIQLDTSIFSDPRFQSLQDNTPTVIELPVGRKNPFVETK